MWKEKINTQIIKLITRAQTLVLLLNCSDEFLLRLKLTYSQDSMSVAKDFERIQNLKHLADTLNFSSFAPLTVECEKELFCVLRHSKVTVEDLKETFFKREIFGKSSGKQIAAVSVFFIFCAS